jgi:hypothetical protein
MSSTKTITGQRPPLEPPGPLVLQVLATILQEPGRPPIGKVIDHVALDVGRPVALSAVLTAALMR